MANNDFDMDDLDLDKLDLDQLSDSSKFVEVGEWRSSTGKAPKKHYDDSLRNDIDDLSLDNVSTEALPDVTPSEKVIIEGTQVDPDDLKDLSTDNISTDTLLTADETRRGAVAKVFDSKAFEDNDDLPPLTAPKKSGSFKTIDDLNTDSVSDDYFDLPPLTAPKKGGTTAKTGDLSELRTDGISTDALPDADKVTSFSGFGADEKELEKSFSSSLSGSSDQSSSDTYTTDDDLPEPTPPGSSSFSMGASESLEDVKAPVLSDMADTPVKKSTFDPNAFGMGSGSSFRNDPPVNRTQPSPSAANSNPASYQNSTGSTATTGYNAGTSSASVSGNNTSMSSFNSTRPGNSYRKNSVDILDSFFEYDHKAYENGRTIIMVICIIIVLTRFFNFILDLTVMNFISLAVGAVLSFLLFKGNRHIKTWFGLSNLLDIVLTIWGMMMLYGLGLGEAGVLGVLVGIVGFIGIAIDAAALYFVFINKSVQVYFDHTS